jgi:2,4-dienoyl-CoA reductase-like NADH-dependent reductase (Old Yellow Enzyme family)
MASIKPANEAIWEGRADLGAFGKPFISNPDLVIRLLLDAPGDARTAENASTRARIALRV